MPDRMSQESREIYARLSAQLAVAEAMVRANPELYLRKASERIAILQEAIEDAMMALSGADDLTFAQRFPHMPPKMVDTTIMRNDKAYKVLQKARNQ